MSTSHHLNIILGIDQTGAVQSNGRPKALPMTCLILKNNSIKKIHTGLYLKKLNKIEINHQLKYILGKEIEDLKILICVDAVLGLPAEIKMDVKKIFKQITNYKTEKSYGVKTAYSFFQSLLKQSNLSQIPQRDLEIKLKANSVFNLTPYQRNIGCGSYRILKDLSTDQTWFDIWPHFMSHKNCIIAEGYPSYFWKTIFKQKSRNLEALKKLFPDLKFKTIDEADSFVLAYGAHSFQNQIYKKPPKKFLQYEGWILGYDWGNLERKI